MKKKVLALVALSALVIIAGCDPFGSDGTKAYITGMVYMDAAMTVPAEGVSIELVADPDSSAFLSQTVFTNAAGQFMMAVEFFPVLPDDESGTGYVLPTSGVCGLNAHYQGTSYTYRTLEEGFVISSGDTLTVWPVSVTDFTGGSQ